MPNLTEEIRLKCEEVLGIHVLKVKWTDNPNVGLALTGEGTGVWIDLTTWKETSPATIFQEVWVLKPKQQVVHHRAGEVDSSSQNWNSDRVVTEPEQPAESLSEPAAEEPVTDENGIEQPELDKPAKSKRATKSKTSKPKTTRKKKDSAVP